MKLRLFRSIPLEKWILFFCISLIIMLSGLKGFTQEYAIGADLSFMKQAEESGYKFKENGTVKPGLQLFKDHGYGWIRLRIFHTPTELPNNLEYTIDLAKEAKKLGYKFLLDFHYSDTWADPGKQFLPVAWEGLSHDVLVDSVFYYTRNTIIAFSKTGAMPNMVQIGNEIINGMLWPDGKIPENWKNFAELVQAGIKGVFAGCENQPVPKIMIQIDQGGNLERTKYFFDNLFSFGIDFDIIGQSYYPWWHGNLLSLIENMNFMAKEYKKPIILVEVAYCYEPTEYLTKNPPFPESPEGQKQFLEEVNQIVLNTPDNYGAGIFWWEPATMNLRGISTRDFFDDDGNVLPVITVFDKYTRY
jgi:arabinogalactan endo-1,4-beta-galactosidase